MKNSDLLTGDILRVRRDMEDPCWDCDCPAKEDPAMMHTPVCAVSPIYAQMVRAYGVPDILRPPGYQYRDKSVW